MNNKLCKILTTSILVGCVSTAYAASNSSRISNLESRIAKIERKAMQAGNILGNSKIFGRILLDRTFVTKTSDQALRGSADLRSGRIGVKGKLAQGWGYKAEVDFAGSSHKVTDIYISKSLSNGELKIGQFKEPFSLENLTSSRFITFLERASVAAYAPGRNIGIGYNTNIGNAKLYTGIFGGNITDDFSNDNENETVSAAARVAYSKNISGGNIHLGAAYRTSKVGNDKYALKVTPEARIDNNPAAYDLKDNGVKDTRISDVAHINQTGLELAATKGRVSVQSEYVNVDIDREHNKADRNLEGYYVQASAFLTEDSRNYNAEKSAFDRVKPNSAKGAIEVAYRFSHVEGNETDDGTQADMDNHTVGVNYYATNNVRFSANFVKIDADTKANENYKKDAEVVAVRAQIDF